MHRLVINDVGKLKKRKWDQKGNREEKVIIQDDESWFIRKPGGTGGESYNNLGNTDKGP